VCCFVNVSAAPVVESDSPIPVLEVNPLERVAEFGDQLRGKSGPAADDAHMYVGLIQCLRHQKPCPNMLMPGSETPQQ
jgi:hypothetical protein